MVTRLTVLSGNPAMAALQEIRVRTPLDIFGIDFDLMPDSRILSFETNAAMNLGMRERGRGSRGRPIAGCSRIRLPQRGRISQLQVGNIS